MICVETFWELFRRLDTVLAHPHRARIFNTCLYMLYMIHCVACSYYALSTWEGIGATTWTFDGHGNAYGFYWFQ
ncbi:Cyclic nucleotide-gated cation channel beta-1 [Orchesella cincta]|uniref:Cyclic nucleotide-gated cation channel beta-1 n=1 Tax=Orchesella cincta TaxID=48709 RepID=A0A1D2MQJ0_ORCCI|nr:Cyclic nucleotide-gated cation channel beta-1 [Orchesella cincta]